MDWGLLGIIWTFNKIVDEMDFKEYYNNKVVEMTDKINRGELDPERLEMFKRMF